MGCIFSRDEETEIDVCCICLDAENTLLNIKCKTCSVYFHYDCMKAIIELSNKHHCPVCKESPRDMFLPLIHKKLGLSEVTLR